MAAKPTPGSSSGTYGTELNEFLDVSLAADGKIADAAVQSTSAAPTTDAMVANKKYVDDGASKASDGSITTGYRYCNVQGVNTKVFTKYFTGTTDADDTTNVAHNLTAVKILAVNAIIQNVGGTYQAFDRNLGATAVASFSLNYNATNIILGSVGSGMQSQAYRIKVEYSV